jgi:NADH-quinone oxidoreductase subunit C
MGEEYLHYPVLTKNGCSNAIQKRKRYALQYCLWVFGNLVFTINYIKDFTITFTISKSKLISLLLILRDHCLFKVDQLIDITAVDYLGRENKRFNVYYLLLSYKYNIRFFIEIQLEEWESILTVYYLYPSAYWLEREVWDMFGVIFNQHPDLRRLLTDYGFRGHPLRKNFPLSGFKETFYDDAQKIMLYEPVELSQEFRMFTFAYHVSDNYKFQESLLQYNKIN